MAVLTEAELLQIRRQLHQIPELALKEYQTHAYLLDVIKQMKQALRNPSMTLAGLMRFSILRKPSMRSAVTLLTITRTTVLMCLPARLLMLRIVARLR